MFKVTEIIAVVTLLAAHSLAFESSISPSEFCDTIGENRNHKDIYQIPEDCHEYIQCYYSGNSGSLGFHRRCEENTFFDEWALTCVEEGPVECTRLHELASERGRLTMTSCRDTLGNILSVDPARPDHFLINDMVLPCPEGRRFDLDMCQCDMSEFEPSLHSSEKACQVWLPFDEDLLDRSSQKFLTFPSGDAVLDHDSFFNGEGSLRVKHGRIMLKAMHAIDLTKIGVPEAASWCFIFRCQGINSYDCLHEGGIISDKRDVSMTNFTIVAAVRPNNRLDIVLGTVPVPTTITVPVNWKRSGWNQACIVADIDHAKVYINAQLVKEQNLNGKLSTGHNAFMIGTDRTYGDFIGNIDDVIACAHPITLDEIKSLYKGDFESLRRKGFFP